MIILFWVLLFFIAYCYFIYPLLVFLLARLFPHPVHQGETQPTVSVIISLYNEEDVIGLKINNLLELDYPVEKLEIIIGSDGSTDRTHEIIKAFSNPRIKLLINPVRQGKMATINGLVSRTSGQIIFFMDARQIIDTKALHYLVSNFADPQVGCVSGELIFTPRAGGTAQGVSLYWRYEKFIRRQEADLHSMLGATGAIYAIRKELFVPGPVDIVLDDMYIPFKIIQQGYRAVFDNRALAFDQVADNPKEEYRRKTRTLYGNYQIFSLFPGLFNPLKSPIAWALFSHKFLRVIIPFFLAGLFVVNVMLEGIPIFRLLLVLQIIFYLMALTGHLIRDRRQGLLKYISTICYVPYVFCLLNFSALVGFSRFIFAKQQTTWQKARGL